MTHAMLLAIVLQAPRTDATFERPLAPEEAAKREARFLANIRQLTDDGECGEGYFSPDGAKIVFQSIRGDWPFYQIYVKDLASGDEQRLSTGLGRTTCAYFHPKKPKMIFASSHLDPNTRAEADAERSRMEELRRNPPKQRSYKWNFDPYMDIFECDLSGGNLRRLTDAPGYDAEGAYSSDGAKIVFSSMRGGNPNLYIMNEDGSEQKAITDAPGYNGGPFFSPDGAQVIFRAEVRRKDFLQIFLINTDGSKERQLTHNDAVNWGPYWHPAGKHVIYSTSVHGHYNYELYLMEVASGATQRVTHVFGADVLPVFSPDGKKLMWTSKRGKDRAGKVSSQLFIADWVGE